MPTHAFNSTRTSKPDPMRLRGAWAGRISGCLLGKPLEILSFREGPGGVTRYLREAGSLPLRDYVPAMPGSAVEAAAPGCCRGRIERAEPDDDINYTVLALMLLEQHGIGFETEDVARAWLRYLPAGTTWTAERAAYRTLLEHMDDEFVNGAAPGFDIARCADNEYCEWIGAQIRTDLYGWVCPGRPELAAELARRDARLSHRSDGVHGAVYVAALGALLADGVDIPDALDEALAFVPDGSGVADAVRFGREIGGTAGAERRLHERYLALSPVHTVNNLAIVVWALSTSEADFTSAVGNAVAAGLDTDCNGATVGGLLGIAGVPIPDAWTRPWRGRVGVNLGGCGEIALDELVARTTAVAATIGDGG